MLKSIPFIILFLCSTVYAQPDFEKLVDAIYLAEGGVKAKVPFGILSVPCEDYAECRQICLNTVRNQYQRWLTTKDYPTYFESLWHRYAPPTIHQLNQNWLKNVEAIYART